MEPGDQTTDRINGVLNFDGTNEQITIVANATLDLSTNFTVSGWFYKNTSGAENLIYSSGTTNTQYWTIRSDPADKIEFNVDGTGGWASSTAIGTAAWHYMAVVKDGDAGTNMSFYVDGQPDGTATVGSVPAATGQTRAIGYRPEGNDFYWSGKLDEIRISSTARLADWIETEYNNQKDNSTFYIIGDEDVLGDCSYFFSKPITIESDEVWGSSDHIDFPFLVNISGDWLKTTTADSTNGRIENDPDGYDIIFRDSYGTQLDHEIEKYDGSVSGGTLIAWVRIPTLSLSVDTVIYMYYGNSCISTSQEDIPGVWNINYKGVWHLDESPNDGVAGHIDSTSNPNDGTPNNFQTGLGSTNGTGRIDGADDFDGADDYVQVTDHTSLDITTNITLSAWIYSTGVQVQYAKIVAKHKGAGAGYPYQLEFGGTSDDKMRFIMWDGTSSNFNLYSAADIPQNTWTYVVGTYDGETMSLYINAGTPITELWSSSIATNNDVLWIGGRSEVGYEYPFKGSIDEVRVSSIPRSAGWIKTCYYNQKANSTFYIIGNETGYAPTAVDLISFTATGQSSFVLVEWETAQEIDNLGFNLYHSTDAYGSYTKLNSILIPGLISSVSGQQYSYIDGDVTRDVLYYYMLEDLDLSGTRTMHGPVCVDWDGDGIPDGDVEDPDDDEEEDTDDDPEVKIPELRFDEVGFGPEGWTPSSSYASWVKMSSFRARQGDEGIALEWETSFEVGNYGFHVYRELNGKFYRITPDLVPGSVFKAG